LGSRVKHTSLWALSSYRLAPGQVGRTRITHLAFYAGWPNAMTATMPREVFEK
jgi:hypothetical protein